MGNFVKNKFFVLLLIFSVTFVFLAPPEAHAGGVIDAVGSAISSVVDSVTSFVSDNLMTVVLIGAILLAPEIMIPYSSFAAAGAGTLTTFVGGVITSVEVVTWSIASVSLFSGNLALAGILGTACAVGLICGSGSSGGGSVGVVASAAGTCNYGAELKFYIPQINVNYGVPAFTYRGTDHYGDDVDLPYSGKELFSDSSCTSAVANPYSSDNKYALVNGVCESVLPSGGFTYEDGTNSEGDSTYESIGFSPHYRDSACTSLVNSPFSLEAKYSNVSGVGCVKISPLTYNLMVDPYFTESENNIVIYRFALASTSDKALVNDWFLNSIQGAVGTGFLGLDSYGPSTDYHNSSTDDTSKIIFTAPVSSFCTGNECTFIDKSIPNESFVAYVAKVVGKYAFPTNKEDSDHESYIAMFEGENKFLNNDDAPTVTFPSSSLGNAIIGPMKTDIAECTTTATTTTPTPATQDGACGTADGKTYAYSDTSYGSDTQCASGVSSNTNFPHAGSSAAWICESDSGGANSGQCSASRNALGVYSCVISSLPANSNPFAEDNSGLTEDTNYTYSAVGDTATKCQFNCLADYEWNGSACVSTVVPTYSCVSSSLPANSNPFAAPDSTGLTANTAYTYSAVGDTATKCQFNCLSGYEWNGSSCAAVTYACLNLPAHANNFAAPDNTGLTANTAYTYSAVGDTATKCQFNCLSGYEWKNGSCSLIPVACNPQNICGMKNVPGIEQADGSCSVPAPSNEFCPEVSCSIEPFDSSQSSVLPSGRAMIKWNSQNADTCVSYSPNWNNQGTKSGSGLTDPLQAESEFVFQCTDAAGRSCTARTRITVGSNPVNGVCSATNLYGCDYGGPAGNKSGESSDSSAYTWNCPGSNGGTTASCRQPKPAPDIELNVVPSEIKHGEQTAVSWYSEDAVSCTITSGGTNITPQYGTTKKGSSILTPDTSKTFTFRCYGNGQYSTVSKSVSVVTAYGTWGDYGCITECSPTCIDGGGVGTQQQSSLCSVPPGGEFCQSVPNYPIKIISGCSVPACQYTCTNYYEEWENVNHIYYTSETCPETVQVPDPLPATTSHTETIQVPCQVPHDNWYYEWVGYTGGTETGVTNPSIYTSQNRDHYSWSCSRDPQHAEATSGACGATANSCSDGSTAIPVTNTDTEYTWTCPGNENGRGCALATSCFLKKEVPTAWLNANPLEVDLNQSSMLTWGSGNGATSCEFLTPTRLQGTRGTSGSVSTGLLTQSPAMFQLRCSGLNGKSAIAYREVAVDVPIINFITASADRVRSGDQVTINWSASGVASCKVTKNGVDWKTGLIPTPSTGIIETISGQTKYVISCLTKHDSPPPAPKSVTVNIAPGFQEF